MPAVLGLLPRGTYLARRGLPSVVLLRGVAAGSFIAAESFVPLMLVTQRGLSPTMAGFSLALGGVTWAGGSWVQSKGRMAPYRERLMVTGMVLVALAIAAAPAVLIESVPVWTLALAWAVGCLGMGLVIGSTSVLLLQLSAPEEAGANSASLQISDALANVVLLAAWGRRLRRPGRWRGGGRAHRDQPARRPRTRPPSPSCSCRWPAWRWWGPGWRPGWIPPRFPPRFPSKFPSGSDRPGLPGAGESGCAATGCRTTVPAMNELIIQLSDAERAECADLADATGRSPEELALDAVRALLRAERDRVGAEALRLAQRHAPLLKRLGA